MKAWIGREIAADELVPSDLRREAVALSGEGVKVRCYVVHYDPWQGGGGML